MNDLFQPIDVHLPAALYILQQNAIKHMSSNYMRIYFLNLFLDLKVFLKYMRIYFLNLFLDLESLIKLHVYIFYKLIFRFRKFH